MNPMLDTIARRQRVIAEMGAVAAFHHFIAEMGAVAAFHHFIAEMGAVAAFHHFIAEGEREGSPSWARQERAALGLLTDKDFAAWERIAPAPEGAA